MARKLKPCHPAFLTLLMGVGGATLGAFLGGISYGVLILATTEGSSDAPGNGIPIMVGALAGAFAGFLAGVALDIRAYSKRFAEPPRELQTFIDVLLTVSALVLVAPALVFFF